MAKRHKTLLINENKVPGPGKYNPKVPLTGRISKIGNSDHLNCEDVKFRNKTGPGTYDPQHQSTKGPSYSMSLKKKEAKVSTF
jgi:hypothetical protein